MGSNAYVTGTRQVYRIYVTEPHQVYRVYLKIYLKEIKGIYASSVNEVFSPRQARAFLLPKIWILVE